LRGVPSRPPEFDPARRSECAELQSSAARNIAGWSICREEAFAAPRLRSSSIGRVNWKAFARMKSSNVAILAGGGNLRLPSTQSIWPKQYGVDDLRTRTYPIPSCGHLRLIHRSVVSPYWSLRHRPRARNYSPRTCAPCKWPEIGRRGRLPPQRRRARAAGIKVESHFRATGHHRPPQERRLALKRRRDGEPRLDAHDAALR
jgi:hypothetical protein